jgi:biopolymer transport protein ExbD
MRMPELNEDYPEIPVVPLIDVMFTLLTFFIVITLFISKARAIDLSLPKASDAPPIDQKIVQVDIRVDTKGNFYVNRAPVTEAQLRDQMRTLSDESLIILAGDEKTRYQDLIRAMDVLRGVGKNKIALAARSLK